MIERVSGSRYVDRPRVERTTMLAETLRSLGKECATVFLAVMLYNVSTELVAEKLQLPRGEAERHISRAASVLRHPSRAATLREYMSEIDSFDPTILIDEHLRSLIREWRLEEMFEALCRQCGHPMPAPPRTEIWQPRTGRPRQYCSNSCRQKAYRMRSRRDR